MEPDTPRQQKHAANQTAQHTLPLLDRSSVGASSAASRAPTGTASQQTAFDSSVAKNAAAAAQHVAREMGSQTQETRQMHPETAKPLRVFGGMPVCQEPV